MKYVLSIGAVIAIIFFIMKFKNDKDAEVIEAKTDAAEKEKLLKETKDKINKLKKTIDSPINDSDSDALKITKAINAIKKKPVKKVVKKKVTIKKPAKKIIVGAKTGKAKVIKMPVKKVPQKISNKKLFTNIVKKSAVNAINSL